MSTPVGLVVGPSKYVSVVICLLSLRNLLVAEILQIFKLNSTPTVIKCHCNKFYGEFEPKVENIHSLR